jgi:hypothetical protein
MEEKAFNLPTVEECREFKRVIDEARAKLGRTHLPYLRWHRAYPGRPDGCLSYVNLIEDIGGYVGVSNFYQLPFPHLLRAALEETVGYRLGPEDIYRDESDMVRIPDEILAVTDPFDALDGQSDEVREEFRKRMVAAGVVR